MKLSKSGRSAQLYFMSKSFQIQTDTVPSKIYLFVNVINQLDSLAMLLYIATEPAVARIRPGTGRNKTVENSSIRKKGKNTEKEVVTMVVQLWDPNDEPKIVFAAQLPLAHGVKSLSLHYLHDQEKTLKSTVCPEGPLCGRNGARTITGHEVL